MYTFILNYLYFRLNSTLIALSEISVFQKHGPQKVGLNQQTRFQS